MDLLSSFTERFFPLFRPHQASVPSAESFDKYGPRQLHTAVQALSLNQAPCTKVIVAYPRHIVPLPEQVPEKKGVP